LRTSLVLSAAALITGTVLVAVPATTGGASAPAEGERYVAFGDSFVSGPGVQPQRSGPCERSEHNFPSQVAEAFGVTEFTDASCGGATTAHLTEAQVRDSGTNPPQLDALDADTTLVTFGTLGGNDMGLVGLAMTCVLGECSADSPGHAQAMAGIEAARTNMLEGIATAQEVAPEADIFVIGYGTYLPEGGCASLPLSPDEVTYIQGMIDLLSDMLAEVAQQSGVSFVDLRDTPNIERHTSCAAPEDQWIRAINTYGDGATLHPSYCGHVAMAQQIIRRIREERGDDVPAFDDSCSGFGAPAEPEEPTVEERSEALKRALRSTDLTTSCRAGDFVAQVRGGQGRVVRVEFRVGKTIKTDRSKPFRVTRKAGRIARRQGRVEALVRVRDAELRKERLLRAKRPPCLRRGGR